MFRLINVLMSKEFVNRLIEVTWKNFDRQDLDNVNSSEKAQFWRDVEDKYGRDEDCGGRISDDNAFTGINPALIVPHSATKLEELRSELRTEALSNVRGVCTRRTSMTRLLHQELRHASTDNPQSDGNRQEAWRPQPIISRNNCQQEGKTKR
ncbi:hypothetical protein L914_02306 [Phytophthora nicotianae]|nr:hypothetical protein L914_02306 [Phytophthora nicotianae]